MKDLEYKAKASESDSRANKKPLLVFKQESSFRNIQVLCLQQSLGLNENLIKLMFACTWPIWPLLWRHHKRHIYGFYDEKLYFKNLSDNLEISLFHKLTCRAFIVDHNGDYSKDDSPKFIFK